MNKYNDQNRGMVVLVLAAISLIWGYSSEWLPYYVKALQGNSMTVLGSLDSIHLECHSSSPDPQTKCSDEYLVNVQSLRKEPGLSIGFGYLMSDVTIGCFDKNEYHQKVELGNISGSYRQSNPYRDYRFISYDALNCDEYIFARTWNREGDIRHGLIGGKVILGNTSALETYKRLNDYIVNGLLWVIAILMLPFALICRWLRNALSLPKEKDLFFKTIYSWSLTILFASGLIQIIFPIPELQAFYRRILNLFALYSMILTACHFTREEAAESPLSRALSALIRPFKFERYQMPFLFSPAFILSILLISPWPLWQFYFVYFCIGFSVILLLFGPRTFPFSIYATVYFLSNLKMANYVWAPESLSGLFFVTLLLFFESVDMFKTEILKSLNLIVERLDRTQLTAAKAVHDIRSPLAVIKLILSEVKWNPEQHEMKDAVTESIEKIRNISKEILDEKRKEIASFATVGEIKHVINAVQNEFGTDTTCILVGNSTPLSLKLNMSSLTFNRVIHNLIKNAYEVANVTRVEIFVSTRENEAVITISNNGDMPNQITLKKILNEGGSFNKVGGTGIGLRYVQDEIRSSNGQFKAAVKNELFEAEIKIPILGESL